MAWLADSPVSMIQCLGNVVENELYQDVAQAGLVFAQTLAGFKDEDYSIEAQQAAFAAAQQAAERGMHEKEEVGHATVSSVEDAVEAAALEIVKLPSIGEALANEAPDEVIDVVVAAAVAPTSNPKRQPPITWT